MYSVKEQTPVRFDAEIGQIFRVVILADTAQDVPTASPTWDSGSICMIAEDHSYKILSNAREWV